MTQYARPSADISRGNWEDESSASTTVYQSIDETTANDTDFITSEVNPASSVYVTKLSTITDPETSGSHVFKYRYKKNTESGCQIDVTLQLRQDYVSEASQGTLIASVFHSDISASFLSASYELSAAEANAITSYSTLYVRLYGDQT